LTFLGVAQVVELSNQLRGRCGKRQVPNVRVAMQHNIGIGGACVVALYRRADGSASTTDTHSSEFKSDVIFEEIKERALSVSQDNSTKNVDATFRFTITSDKGNKKSWTVDLKKSPPYIGTENDEKVDVELLLSDSDFIEISKGTLKPDQAFMQGKMKIKGNIMKAMKLKTILDPSQLKAKL
jgi:sterol carrier protein 2